ncbi:hypothetical protein ABE28_002030 [Peribacillus muralis]|uniref:Uncharacterized protein n=1 Tax=Peribacillus muralis TaxID=264697 RepID=A0A1B3XIS4_9BACI|nr:hypothetical protein ABE28_002030 [Peribacillus muralis]
MLLLLWLHLLSIHGRPVRISSAAITTRTIMDIGKMIFRWHEGAVSTSVTIRTEAFFLHTCSMFF